MIEKDKIAEIRRLSIASENNPWKKWGPYLTERQWGTVREDYSPYGSAWDFCTHEMAKSKAYRWGEEGIGGISDNKSLLCFGWAFWNGKDKMLKERLFGLGGNEGNHGEDVKELYYYLDSTPTHSYMKMLYKYPHNEFPYDKIYKENSKRGKKDPEYELVDTGVFDNSEYWDIFMEYAKAGIEDILIRATIINRGNCKAKLHVLPTLWWRNTWRIGKGTYKPSFKYKDRQDRVTVDHESFGNGYLYCKVDGEWLFCDNETNFKKLIGIENAWNYCKDGINDYVVEGDEEAVNPDKVGSKVTKEIVLDFEPYEEKVVELRICVEDYDDAFADFNKIFNKRKKDADEFYDDYVQAHVKNKVLKNIQRTAYAGMMWTKQFYYFNIQEWLDGDPGNLPPPGERQKGRNSDWRHLSNSNIISMPDKWEYPWYAAWDLAFHTIPIARIDPDFAKRQLLIMVREYYMHPNGQIPAYEWHFGDVNPPVHAWATWRVFEIDKEMNGKPDMVFLERVFHKLLLNFTWWVNRKDAEGNNIFQGGFLGLDNIGVFDRSRPLPTGGTIQQADGTSWMAMYALNMLRIATELSLNNPTYQDLASKFFEHFLYIAGAMNDIGSSHISLWDNEDEFFYDVLQFPDGDTMPLKIRSMVGLIPLYAVEVLTPELLEKLPDFKRRVEWVLINKPQLASLVSRWYESGKGETKLLSLLRGHRIKCILTRMLDETEFLSTYGIRALSKYHEENPYVFKHDDDVFTVNYLPAESDSGLFGGNSNWRGPIWFPVNYMIIESLLKFHQYYGDDFKIEYPTGSGKHLSLRSIAEQLSKRLMRIFIRNKDGIVPFNGDNKILQEDPHFKDLLLFYEYFHGENGRGVGASHQTGWTGLIADLIHDFYL